jgi:hypothetical protein
VSMQKMHGVPTRSLTSMPGRHPGPDQEKTDQDWQLESSAVRH